MVIDHINRLEFMFLLLKSLW